MLETQDWWTQPGAAIDGESEHIHLSTCFPGRTDGERHRAIRPPRATHMNPGVLTKVAAYVFGNGISVEQVAALPNYTCPTTQCDLWYHLDYDTTRVPSDGYLGFRFHAVTAPDGSLGYTSTGWQVTLASGGGRPTQNYRTPPFTEARGWYTGTDYENARLTSTLPRQPVSGLWTCNVKLAPGSGGAKTTRPGHGRPAVPRRSGRSRQRRVPRPTGHIRGRSPSTPGRCPTAAPPPPPYRLDHRVRDGQRRAGDPVPREQRRHPRCGRAPWRRHHRPEGSVAAAARAPVRAGDQPALAAGEAGRSKGWRTRMVAAAIPIYLRIHPISGGRFGAWRQQGRDVVRTAARDGGSRFAGPGHSGCSRMARVRGSDRALGLTPTRR